MTPLRTLLGALVATAVLAGSAGCAPATDEAAASGLVWPAGATAPAPAPDARPVVIDTDLGADDLLALAHLLQRPDLDVLAVTVSGTGLVRCGAGVELAADVVASVTARPIPVACGRQDAGGGRTFPGTWRDAADARSGLPPADLPATIDAAGAPELLRRVVATAAAPVTVIALGPFTNLADTLPDVELADVAAVHAMAGALRVPGNGSLADVVAGPAEWNVLADPAAFAAVLGSGIPLTLVPLDAAVPAGPDLVDALDTAVDHAPSSAAALVRHLLVSAPTLRDPAMAWWDALAALALVEPTVVADDEVVPVRVERSGPWTGALAVDDAGTPVRVVTALHADRVAALLAGPLG